MIKPTADRARELFDYDPLSGVFRHKTKPSKKIRVGQIAGSEVGNGYRRLKIDGRDYYAHRVAWLYVYGAWPNNQIDHVDGAKQNNAISNLRDVSPSVNGQNQKKAQRRNKNCLLGVSPHWGKYRAVIQVESRQKYLGMFETAEAAYQAYLAAKRELHEGCTL